MFYRFLRRPEGSRSVIGSASSYHHPPLCLQGFVCLGVNQGRDGCRPWSSNTRRYDAARVIWQVVGKVRSAAGTKKSVFHPSPVFSTSLLKVSA